MNQLLNDSKAKMEKTLQHLKSEFSKMRVGRATAAMVDGVRVDVYGSSMTLKEVAALNVPDARTITIQPWDKGVIGEIEKGIHAANIGLTPMNDGKLIRLTLPPLTEERRKDLAKVLKKQGEDAKVVIRNLRRDALDGMKNLELPEDQQKRFQDEIQKLTDQFTKETDKIVDAKSQEVSTL